MSWLIPFLDLIVVAVAIEYAVIVFVFRSRMRAAARIDLALFLCSGALLIAAVRVALSNGSEAMIGGLLSASFICHGVTLWRSKRQIDASPSATHSST